MVLFNSCSSDALVLVGILYYCQASSFTSLLQGQEALAQTESGIPRDASGAIDYNALANLLKDMQCLQDQADILFILFKDK